MSTEMAIYDCVETKWTVKEQYFRSAFFLLLGETSKQVETWWKTIPDLQTRDAASPLTLLFANQFSWKA